MSNISEVENIVEFVDEVENVDDDWEELKVDNDYLICKAFPHQIKRKSNGRIVSESISNKGYIQMNLNGKTSLKHVIVANQWLENDDPEQKTQVDHINHDTTDYHLINLRWISPSMNCKNKSSHRGVNYQYVDNIPDESIIVDFYDTRYERHEFKDYYYYDGNFFYDNEMNYRILHVNETKCGSRFISMKDINGKTTSVYINRFLQQHDLL